MTIDIDNNTTHFVGQSVDNLDLMVNTLSSEAAAVNDDLSDIIAELKAGATALGLLPVSALATDLESVLEDIQLHQRPLTPTVRTALLSAITVLKASLPTNAQKNEVRVTNAKDSDEEMLSSNEMHSKKNETMPTGLCVWDIDFNPALTFLQSGGEPTLIFQALAILGDLTVVLDDTALPLFSELDPEHCFLSWQLSLTSYASQQDIEDIFKQHQAEDQVEITQRETQSIQTLGLVTANAISASNITVAKTDELNILQDLLTELTQTQLTLHRLGEHFNPTLSAKFDDSFQRLTLQTQAIEDVIRQMRLWPFHHLYRQVKWSIEDLAATLGVKVEFKVTGGELEIDKMLIEQLVDPLTQLAMIAFGRDVELNNHKPDSQEMVTLKLNSMLRDRDIIIDLSCVGSAVDDRPNTTKIIAPSTVVTDTVQKAIANLGGRLDVDLTPEQDTRYTVSLSQSHWVMQGQLILAAGERYILPLSSVIESWELESLQFKNIAGKGELYLFNDEYIPVIHLAEILDLSSFKRPSQQLLTIVDVSGKKIGLVVDELLGQQRIVVNDLATHYRRVKGFSGACILSDDSVALVLNPVELIQGYILPFDEARLNVAEAAL